MKLKYIIFNNNSFVIFPETIKHSDVPNRALGTPTSAGFVHIETECIKPFGESISLGLESKPEDEQLIWRLLNLDLL